MKLFSIVGGMSPYNLLFRSGLKHALSLLGGMTRMGNLSVLGKRRANIGGRTGTVRNGMVYLLDDDKSVLKATGRLLQAAGRQISSFTDPVQFLDRAQAHQPACVVIDVRMPIMDGLKVQSRLKEVAPFTRVILLTSNDDPEVRRRALANGAGAFFLKPVSEDDFLASIAVACNGTHKS
jgi:FixJ family two-component response regulator